MPTELGLPGGDNSALGLLLPLHPDKTAAPAATNNSPIVKAKCVRMEAFSHREMGSAKQREISRIGRFSPDQLAE